MIGERIKSLREATGLSQAELARKLSISKSSVNAWESGLSAPTAAYIIEMAKLFHCSSDYILCIDEGRKINLAGLTDEEVKLLFDLLLYFNQKK